MNKSRLTNLTIAVAAASLFILTNLLADLKMTSVANTVAAAKSQTATADTAEARTHLQPADSLSEAKSKNYFSRFIAWANSNEGFITLFTALVAGVWALFLFMRSRERRHKKQLSEAHLATQVTSPQSVTPDAEPDEFKPRYLEHILTVHQHLPVAGFETNLRVPIPLEKVYVTLRARMTELERARGVNHARFVEPREFQPDRAVTVQEALSFAVDKEYDGVVILGQPGSGKTTLAKYFLLCFAAGKAQKNLGLSKNFLPLLLFLREVEPQKSLVENIMAPLQKHQLGLPENFFLPFLKNGEAIILLDGLDEVATEEKRRAVSHWIHHQVHLAFPRCPVIVTSRFSGYRGDAVLPGYYLRLEIQEYDLSQVKQFLENWLAAVETHVHEDNSYWRTQAKQKAEDLHRRIHENAALRDLAVNPLMLQIIALVHRDRGTLPERRVELYKECTDVLLERWDKAKGLDVVLSAAQSRQLLQPVALWMHSVENRREVSQQEILQFIAPIVPQIERSVNPEDLLKSWQERCGIFKGEGETYFFHHLSFQEYLTAEELLNNDRVDILVKNFDNAWWREPTLLAMGLTKPRFFSKFMAALLRANRRDGAGVDLMLRCIDETLRRDETPFVEGIKRLKRTEARYNCLLGLERIGTEQAKAAVRQALNDQDEHIANQARTILAKWGETPAKEKLETLKVIIKGKAQQLPARLFNPVELNAEYILIPGSKEKIIFKSTGKPAPDYPLYFAKYPVTNKLYNRFLAYLAGKSPDGRSRDDHSRGLEATLPRERFAQSLLAKAATIEGFAGFLGKNPEAWAEKLDSYHDKRFNGDDQPAVRVSWFAATAYCHWLTELHQNGHKSKNQNESYIFRLPIEEEWEWAASGGKREYPWGKESPDETRANYGEKVGHTTPVGAYPAGATPEGLMDMAGNVWEWCENLYGPEAVWGKEARALRGGSWVNTTQFLACAARNDVLPGDWDVSVGWRVVCAASHSF
jgi:formylglycine-generating enzyme required for sulfatase activity